MSQPMMPKPTALWMIENTGLSFRQIAEFCGLHELEVPALPRGEVMGGMAPLDPVLSGQVTAEEIKRGEADPTTSLRMVHADTPPPMSRAKGARYTPISKRQDKPDGIAWLLKNHPELSDAQVCKLLGTTKSTIAAVRDRTHWNSTNIRPRDPIDLGLCTYLDLSKAIEIARGRAAAKKGEEAKLEAKREAKEKEKEAPADSEAKDAQ